jgi:UDP-2,3-diacylglucosamine pyrophosphatase LpxH
MKIVYTSDLHIIDDRSVSYTVISKIAIERPDYVVLGGDLVDFHRDWDNFLKTFATILDHTKICILLGNHDLWSLGTDTLREREDVYEHVYEKCQEYGITFLEEDPVIADKTLLCGSIAWYDYSVKPEATNKEFLIINKKRFNNDGNYIHSRYSDIEYSDICQKKLLKNIKKNQKLVDNIFVFTHVPILKECIVPAPPGHKQHEWDMSNCYFFNLSLGDKIKKIKKIKMIISGHIHRYTKGILPSGIHYATCGSDYQRPEILVINCFENDINIERVS